MNIKTLTIDLGKRKQHVCAYDKAGNEIFRKILNCAKMHELLLKTPPCTVGMEACATSHHWARTAKKHGHNARVIAPKFVKMFSNKNFKNDFNDAEAIYEAITRPRARFVSIKSHEQQQIAFLHRIRTRLVENRTQLITQLRSYLGELGYDDVPRARSSCLKFVYQLCDPTIDEMTPLIRRELELLLEEFRQKEEHIKDLTNELKKISIANPIAKKLLEILGIGHITATALLCEVGDFNIFESGREFAAWLGLVPRQNTTGGKQRLGRITKAGNSYLRRLLVHGARSVYQTLSRTKNKSRTQSWMENLCKRRATNIAVVAMANKMARIVWAVVVHDRTYDPKFVSKPPVFTKKAAA